MLALSRGDRRGIDFATLVQDVARMLQQPETQQGTDAAPLVPALMSLYERDMVEVHAARWDFTDTVSERPRATPYARWLAERGAPVVNAAHGTFYLPTAALRRVVMLLDGTRSVDALLEALAATTPPAELQELNADTLQRRLQLLADNALLVA